MEQKNRAPYYNMKSDFGKDHPLPSYTFGIARQFYEKVLICLIFKVYCESSGYRDKSVPGPDAYTYTKEFGTEASKYTMRGKGNSKPIGAKMNVPGPGEYGFIAMNPAGKYARSNFKNATTIVWASSKEKRFKYPGILLLLN
jgi:hypothetical protein